MADPLAVVPDDRLLFLLIPPPEVVVELCATLTKGMLVALGGGDAVASARRAHRELDNAMFITSAPEEIPWREAFFTKVIGPAAAVPESEIARVMAPGGRRIL
ncbi:MAG: hypothetical protein ABI165_09955 [Bryobacteraceae bacterium]